MHLVTGEPGRHPARPTPAAPLLVDDTDPVRAFAAFHNAVRTGHTAAVHDRRWPSSLVEPLRDALPAAAAGSIVVATSGSVGLPRAVVRTVASWDASTEALSEVSGIGADDVVWLPGPLSSSLTLHGAWHARAVGAHAVLGPVPGRRDGAARRPALTHVTAAHLAPAGLPDLLSRHRDGGLPALRTVLVAGDAVPPRLRDEVRGAGLALVTYYGAAELSFVGVDAGPGGPSDAGATAYTPFPGVQVEVRDGVLWARSSYLADGYLDTGGSATQPLRRDGAWASVGDRGRALPGGRFAVLGRGDTVVTTGGVTVQAEEVEAALLADPHVCAAVAGLVVVGVPDARLGQLVAAVVEPAPGCTPGADTRDLHARLRRVAAALPRAARPRRWHVVERLPRTVVGKPDRTAAGNLAARP